MSRTPDMSTGLETMFEYDLARHLEGFATLIASASGAGEDIGR
ncbi:hypothetical protein [Nocardia flavorosea]|nr:hypothetical protein [Nocardia flavorosea]